MQERARDDGTLLADLLVVGGGMVGMTLACATAGAGLRTVLVDRADPRAQAAENFDGRVTAIALGSRRVLEGAGAWLRMAPDAEPILAIRTADADSTLFLHYDHREVGDEPFGHIVENRTIRAALAARAAELPLLTVLAPAAIAALDRGASRVEARLADGVSVRADLVAAADGRRSRLRAAAGIRVTEWAYPQTSIVCTVAHERPHRGVAVERFLPAGPFAILPMTGNRSSIVWTERADLVPAILALDDEEFLDELALRFGEHLGRLEVRGPRWPYPLSLLHAQAYSAERLVLVGDAAHAIHPIAGQGFNLGLRDVAALAELLVDAHRRGDDLGDAAVLAGYKRWRRFDVLALEAVTDGLNRLFSNAFPPLRLARDLGLAAVGLVPPLKRFFMRDAMGVTGDLPRLLRGKPLL